MGKNLKSFRFSTVQWLMISLKSFISLQKNPDTQFYK